MDGFAVRDRHNPQPTTLGFCNGGLATYAAVTLHMFGLWVRDGVLNPCHLDLGAIRALPRGVEVPGCFHWAQVLKGAEA